jgi:hypothetical protein
MLDVNAINISDRERHSSVIVISTSNPTLLGPAPKQNYLDRLKHDDRVKQQTWFLM